jgi:hypothetical protein
MGLTLVGRGDEAEDETEIGRLVGGERNLGNGNNGNNNEWGQDSL